MSGGSQMPHNHRMHRSGGGQRVLQWKVHSRRPVMRVVFMSQALITKRIPLAFLLLAVVLSFWSLGAASECEPLDITQLVDNLESHDPATQAEAAEALARIVEDVREAVPQLERLLKSKNTDARLAGVRALWAVRGKSKAHLSILVSGLNDEKACNRENAAKMLGQLGPQAVLAVPLLATALKDSSADVRIEAADALGDIGPMAKSAIPDLVAALMDRSKSSVCAIGFGPYTVSDAAGLALRNIGPDAVPAIVPFLKHDNKDIRVNAMWVLAGGGKTSQPYIPVLIEALNDEDDRVRQAAVEIFGDLRIAPMESVPALAALLKDRDENIRFWAATSLARYGTQAEPVLQDLLAALQDEHPGVRARAADAIGEIGPAAKEALPQLTRLREDQAFFFYPHAAVDYVSPHAVEAIARIQSKHQANGNDK